MTRVPRLITAALILSLAACSGNEEPTPVDKNVPVPYMLYSPNGEPLNGGPLGKPTCEQALSHWFDRLSADGSHIDKNTFFSDMRTQFNRMDIDHNGYIVSEELDRFREPYRQQPPQKHEEKDEDSKDGGHHRHKGKGERGDEDANPTDLSFTTADPVMSADANLDFRVTLPEFLHQANDIFTRLDSNHDGLLDQTEILSQCEKKKP